MCLFVYRCIVFVFDYSFIVCFIYLKHLLNWVIFIVHAPRKHRPGVIVYRVSQRKYVVKYVTLVTYYILWTAVVVCSEKKKI